MAEKEDARKAFDEQQASRAAAFKADQEARAAVFENEQAARVATFERLQAEAEAAQALAEKVAAARAECDELALKEGRITPAEIASRDTMIRQQGFDALMPWQVFPEEGRKRCAFLSNVMLILPNVGHSKVFFSKGYDDVPESLVDHKGLDGSIVRDAPAAKVSSASDQRAADEANDRARGVTLGTTARERAQRGG